VTKRRRSRGRKRNRNNNINNATTGKHPYPEHFWSIKFFSTDIYAPSKRLITPSLLVCTLYPIWAHCLVNPLIKRDVEERKVDGSGSWQQSWGEFQWMLIAAGAKHPSWDSDCAYIDAALGHSCGISRKTFLPTGKILGLALVRRPRTATSFDEEGSSSSDGDGDWAYSGGSILHGKWSALMGSALTTEHWRVCRVICFTQPIAGPWLLQGPPKKLSSYQQGAQLLKWVIYRLEHQHYTYAQY
tara:strand:- start:2633 stop:3361 length:729 start_codon:yes stop_codon:yes gene_type:complete